MRDLAIPIFISIGAIITIALAWVQWDNDRKKDEENVRLDTENKRLLNRIADLSENTANNLTGGDSRPLLIVESE